MTWAGKRQAIILSVIILFSVIIISPIVFKSIPNASCSDNKKNQDESGVDCGGVCQKICKNEAISPTVIWVRPFEVAKGVVSATAYVANGNAGVVARSVRYTMKIYDKDGILLGERAGLMDIPAKTSFPVFEGAINIGEQDASSAFFDINDDINWEKYEPKDKIEVEVISQKIITEETSKLFATIRNNSNVNLQDFPVVAIIYNTDGNAIASSQTKIDSLKRNEAIEVAFTWLKPFVSDPGRVEIYPKIPLYP